MSLTDITQRLQAAKVDGVAACDHENMYGSVRPFKLILSHRNQITRIHHFDTVADLESMANKLIAAENVDNEILSKAGVMFKMLDVEVEIGRQHPAWMNTQVHPDFYISFKGKDEPYEYFYYTAESLYQGSRRLVDKFLANNHEHG